MKKITLSADEETVRQAKRIAKREKTSVSALFAHFIRYRNQHVKTTNDVPADSLAARATGFLTLPKGKTPRDILTEALLEKYGWRR
jgi:hypothetical protein